MEPITLSERTALAEKLRSLKQTVAEAVTDEFFEHHPDWQEALRRAGAEARHRRRLFPHRLSGGRRREWHVHPLRGLRPLDRARAGRPTDSLAFCGGEPGTGRACPRFQVVRT